MHPVTPFIPYKLLLHRERLEASVRGDLVFPISVELDLSNKCPHDCGFCSFGTSESQGYRQSNWVTFPTPRIYTLLEELASCGVLSVTFTGGGEPLVHPEAARVFRAATAAGLQWGLVTNGLLLRGPASQAVAECAKFVRVSLDAGSDATHMVTHGIKHPQWTTILGNMSALRTLAKTTGNPLIIGASFCVMGSNWREIYQAAVAVRDAGGNYLEIRPTFPTEWRGDGWKGGLDSDTLDLALAEITSARTHLSTADFQVIGMSERFDSLANPAKRYSQCRIGPLTTVIGADGRAWHCCIQRGQRFFELGSVLDTPFREFWTRLHSKRDSSKIDVSQCPRCRYDGYNELLEQAVLADGMHSAFV